MKRFATAFFFQFALFVFAKSYCLRSIADEKQTRKNTPPAKHHEQDYFILKYSEYNLEGLKYP